MTTVVIILRRIQTTPALLIDLRVDKKLYEEALALHYNMIITMIVRKLDHRWHRLVFAL